MSAKGLAIRASFEDCLYNQSALLQYLADLIKDNRPLREDERIPFLEIVARALLGQGTRIPIEMVGRGTEYLRIKAPDLPGETTVENADDLLRFLAFTNLKVIVGEGGKKSIGELWRMSREFTLRTLPLSLERAAAMSAERVPYERARGYAFRPGKEAEK